MHITFGPRGILQIDDAKLIFRNFSGEANKFNREGDRNFAIIIEDRETADALANEGWNVKIKPPRDTDEEPFMYMSVKVKFNGRGPHIHLTTNDVTNKLDEDSICCLDHIYIAKADMDIAPFDWDVNGKTGRAAYLRSMHVVQEVEDRFAERFNQNDSDDYPF